MTKTGMREWLRALAQPTTFLGATMLVLVVATPAHLVNEIRKDAVKDALDQERNLVRLLDQYVTRLLKSADTTLLQMRRFYERDPANRDLVAWATDPSIRNDLTFQFSIIGPDGVIVASSYGSSAIGLYVGDLEHFRAHLGAAEDNVFVSKPVTLKTSGRRSIILTRRLVAPDGSFGGVLSASFEIIAEELERFMRSIELGPDGTAALVGLDGVVRMRAVNGRIDQASIGQQFPLGAGVLGYAREAKSGNYWNTPGVIDGVRRLVSYRVLEPFPLVAMVTMSESEVHRRADYTARIYWSISLLLAAGILTAIAIAALREKKLISASKEITHQALHDGLTGLMNRTAFREQVGHALGRLKRFGECFDVFMIDLDNFKTINDSLGHAAGDDLIGQVARRLEGAVRGTDVVARLGGDEFAVLQMAHDHPRDGAIVLANRILRITGEPYDLKGRPIIVEVSLGIAAASAEDSDIDQVLNKADLALYQAKFRGKNTYHVFEAGADREACRHYGLDLELQDALRLDQLEVHYQLVIDAATRLPRGVEALMRWKHPQRGIIMPGVFIPIAENSGLITRLDEWLLRRACIDALKWPSDIKIAVNLSAMQFRKGDIVGVVSSALRDSGLAPNRLELEITESVLLHRDDANLAKLHELKNLGVSIALDDFGTGYSSLSYLRTFPFDKIKIDRSFVAEMANRSDCAAIVCAVTGLARALNMTITAEGVESENQFELLRAAGCTQVQGYLFGRPCPASELQFAAKWEQARQGTAA